MVECAVKSRVLLVEGRPTAADRLRRALVYAGYEAVLAHGARASVAATIDKPPDVEVIDLDATEYDGLTLCRRLRHYSDAPVLILGSHGTTAETVAAFEAGADDYMAPPIALEELQARVGALLRRARRGAEPGMLKYAGLVVDTLTRTVTRSSRRVMLTSTEFDLLTMLLSHPDEVLSHQFLLEGMWRHPATATITNLEWLMHSLRTKLEADGEDRLIQTVRGIGYALRPRTRALDRDRPVAREVD